MQSDAQLPSRPGVDRPRFVDQECDIALPRRLFASVIIHGRDREIVRALSEEECNMLTARAAELRAGLMPFSEGQRNKVDAAIGAMFGGFRAMRQEGESAVALVDVTRFILREFPCWAIEEGCLKIAQGKAGLDRRYAPNDAQIHEVVSWIVRPYADKARVAHALLTARVEPAEARRPLAQAPRVGGRAHGTPHDTAYLERVFADLAARKLGREGEQDGESGSPRTREGNR